MAIAGASYGASKALEEIMAEQMLRAQMEQRQKQAEAQLALQQRQMEGVEQDRQLLRDLQTRDRDLAAQKYRDDQAEEATDRNIGLDAANVLNMPGMTDEAKANEFRQSALRNPRASSTPGMLKIVEGLTKKPEQVQYTHIDPKTGKRTLKFAQKDQIPEGGLDLGNEPPKPTGGAANYLTLIDSKGNQRRVPDGPQANQMLEQGWRLFDSVANRQQTNRQTVHPQLIQYSQNLIRKVDDLIGRDDDPNTKENEAKPSRINNWTAGGGGTVMRNIPLINTDAKNVDAELFSLTSELAIAALQKMRASSLTGGAVGNVALGEMKIMENAQAAMRNDQSPQNLVTQLKIIRDSEQRFLDEVERDMRENDPGFNRGITVTKPIPPGEKFSVVAPNGKTYTFDSAEALAQFKAQAGLK